MAKGGLSEILRKPLPQTQAGLLDGSPSRSQPDPGIRVDRQGEKSAFGGLAKVKMTVSCRRRYVAISILAKSIPTLPSHL